MVLICRCRRHMLLTMRQLRQYLDPDHHVVPPSGVGSPARQQHESVRLE